MSSRTEVVPTSSSLLPQTKLSSKFSDATPSAPGSFSGGHVSSSVNLFATSGSAQAHSPLRRPTIPLPHPNTARLGNETLVGPPTVPLHY